MAYVRRRDMGRRSVQLARRVDTILDDLDSLTSDWDTLKESVREWAKALEILAREPHLENGVEEEPTVFSLLTSGMDDTLDLLRDIKREKPTENTQPSLEQLEGRVAYHTESVALILAHFERERSIHTPNSRIELQRMDDVWAWQKAHLEDRLKDVFACASPDLLWRNYLTTLEPLKGLCSSSLGASPMYTSIPPFIARLKFEPQSSFLDLSQSTSFDALMRASIYLLHTLQVLLCDTRQGVDNTKLTKVFVALYKCAWVVHNLVKHSESLLNMGWMKQITKLILHKLTYNFNNCKQMRFPFADSMNIESRDLWIKDPLGGSPKEKVPRPQSRRPDESISLLVAAVADPLDQQEWIPSEVLIFKEGTNFRLRILSNRSLHPEIIIVNSEADEIVPGYAFKADFPSSHPTLWFQQNGRLKELCFSYAKQIEDLIYFTNYFIRDAELIGYFPLIDEIYISKKKGSEQLRFLGPTAQAWTAIGDENMTESHSTLQSAQTQPRNSIGPIGERIEESKILFFCDSSIFTLLVTGAIDLSLNDATSLNISCAPGGSAHFPMYMKTGTRDEPAGMSMASSPTSRRGEREHYTSLRMKFPTPKGMQVFVHEFAKCQKKWLQKAKKLKSQRDSQRNLIIESESCFGD